MPTTKLHMQIGRVHLRAEKIQTQWRFKCSAFPDLEDRRAENANATIAEFERRALELQAQKTARRK